MKVSIFIAYIYIYIYIFVCVCVCAYVYMYIYIYCKYGRWPRNTTWQAAGCTPLLLLTPSVGQIKAQKFFALNLLKFKRHIFELF